MPFTSQLFLMLVAAAVLFLVIVVVTAIWKGFCKFAEGFLDTSFFQPKAAVNPVAEVSPVAPVVSPPVAAAVEPVEVEPVEVESVEVEPEIVASPLVVKQLNQGRASLILRYRARKQACTAMLIIWSGAKRRRVQDSYYDLGIIARNRVDDWVVDQFMGLAQTKLVELQTNARKSRKAKVVADEPQLAMVQEQQEVVVDSPEPVSDVNDQSHGRLGVTGNWTL